MTGTSTLTSFGGPARSPPAPLAGRQRCTGTMPPAVGHLMTFGGRLRRC